MMKLMYWLKRHIYLRLITDIIIIEMETITAFLPFDDLGNEARIVKSFFYSLGHLIPELEEFYREILSYEIRYRPGHLCKFDMQYLEKHKNDNKIFKV